MLAKTRDYIDTLKFYMDAEPSKGRDFYEIFAVANSLVARLRHTMPSVKLITRARAIHFGWDLPRLAAGQDRPWHGGFLARPADYFRDDMHETILRTAEASKAMLVEYEAICGAAR